MAVELPVLKISRPAGADLSALQYTFVKFSGTGVVACSAATDVPAGILQNKPVSGATAEVMVFGESKLKSSAGLAVGALVGTTSSGLGVALTPGTDTTKYVVGQVSLASANANELCSVLLNAATPHRAA